MCVCAVMGQWSTSGQLEGQYAQQWGRGRMGWALKPLRNKAGLLVSLKLPVCGQLPEHRVQLLVRVALRERH